MTERKNRFRPSQIPGVRRVSRRLDHAISWRVDQALVPLRERLDVLEQRVDQRLPQAANKANAAHTEVQRMEPQVASMEQRLEELRERVDTNLEPGTSAERAEARRLIEAVRTEHERIRSRMTAIAWYEDRLRKVEERLDDSTAQ
jgi:hypothetical protein